MTKIHALRRNFFLLLILFSFLACNSDVRKNKADCPKGAPSPIYNSDYNFVISHDFKVEGQNSSEKIIFSDQLELTIRQSGCDKIFQSYIFSFKGNYGNKEDTYWLDLAVQVFYKLGSFEEKFYAFNLWANKIQEHKSDFKLTESFQAEPGVFIKIDRIVSENGAELIIDLYED